MRHLKIRLHTTFFPPESNFLPPLGGFWKARVADWPVETDVSFDAIYTRVFLRPGNWQTSLMRNRATSFFRFRHFSIHRDLAQPFEYAVDHVIAVDGSEIPRPTTFWMYKTL